MQLDHLLTEALLSESGKPLDGVTREVMENGFSADFSDVVVHASPRAAFANRLLASKAFTIGRHVFFADGAYRPRDRSCQLLIAHELAHVVQKRLGSAATQANPSDPAAEAEAHTAAAAVTQGARYRCTIPVQQDTPSCWGEAGHYYTANYVLQAAGVDAKTAAEIAFYAQMGDEVIELDATEQGIKWLKMAATEQAAYATSPVNGAMASILLEKSMRVSKEIGMGLHCLTGAASDCETAWRAHVLETAPQTAGNLALGLAVHAFGDSFAHRDISDPRKMYPPVIGHGRIMIDDAKKGKMPSRKLAEIPDHLDQRPDLYRQYGEELYAIARYRWQAPLARGISLSLLRDTLTEIASVSGEKAQILKIRYLSARWCGPISLTYFPELKIYDDGDYKDCVSYDRFMAIHKLPSNFLDRARAFARGWSYMSARGAPGRKSKVSDYDVQPTPPQSLTKQQRTHTVAPGDSLWAIAKRYYGSTEKWPSIWNEPENRKLIGANPNLIQVGWILVIP